MFAVALLLTEPKRLTVIPMSWFSSLDIVQIFNIGISHTKSHRIFFSPNPEDEPIFNLPISTVFSAARANYLVKVLSVWATSEDANTHMESRRHLLPAIYNANLERFHFTTTDVTPANDVTPIKEELMEGLVWLNEANVLEISDSEPDSEDENGADQVPYDPENLIDFTSEPKFDDQENLIDFTSEPEFEDENGTSQHIDTSQDEELKPVIVFPDAPNEIIDLTPDNDLIRNIIAFSEGNIISELKKELDCCYSWTGNFPTPIGPVKQENDPKMVVENDSPFENNGNKLDSAAQNIDSVLGKLKFEVQDNGDRIIEFEDITLKMPLKLHVLLEEYNKHRLYSSDYFDAKFVLITVSSLIREIDLRDGGNIQADDARLNFSRKVFRHRVQDDQIRMQWYAGHILKVNEWLKKMH